MRGRMTGNVDVDKRLTLIGDGAGMAATNVNLILGTKPISLITQLWGLYFNPIIDRM